MVDCRRVGLIFGVFITFLPATGVAQYAPTPAHSCATCPPNACGVCGVAAVQCTCAVTTMQPVVSTTQRRELYTAYRDVPQVEYRRVAQQEQVPVTSYKTVTADEGSYQRVWVPKVVSRQVPETRYQQRTTWKTVPYQTTRRVAEVHSRTVPQRTVQYVPRATHTAACYPGFGYAPTTAHAAPLATRARTAATPYLPPRRTPEPQLAMQPVPDPRFLETPGADDDGWTSVAARNRSTETAKRTAEPHSDLFSPLTKPTRTSSRPRQSTPSAATVWRSRYR